MTPSIRELRYFVTAADRCSLTSAASALNVSQSSISLAVAALERKLGVQLFIRSHARGVALTSAGVAILREARRLLADISDLEATASSLGSEPQGSLTVGCLACLVPRYLITTLRGFGDAYPRIKVDFTEVDQTTLYKQLMTGETDIAVTLLDMHGKLQKEVLCELPPSVLTSADHRLARKSKIELQELSDEPAVLLDLPASQDYYRNLFSAAGVTPNIRYRTGSIETVRSLVANGLAYSVLNQRSDVRTSLDGQKLCRIGLRRGLPTVRIMAMHPAGTRLRHIAQLFLQHMRDALKAETLASIH
jgi:DNA-binding transcriptional LysR family regulator